LQFRPKYRFIHLLVAGCLYTGGFSIAQSGSDRAAMAMRALQQRDFASAVSAANDGLKENPQDCRLLTIRGLALQNLDKPEEGLASFQQALSFCPRFLPALEGTAQIEYAQHSPHAAQSLDAILAIRPDDPTAHAMLAVLNWQKGDCQSAVDHFAKGGQQVETNQTAQMEYGICLIETGDTQKAEETFQRLMQQSGSEMSRQQYAYAAWKNKDYAHALDALAPLVTTPSANSSALRLAAQIAEENGDTPHAVQWLRQAIVADPKNVDNYVIFAAISFAHDSFQVGVDMIDAGLKQLPQEARLYLARGVLLVQLSQFEPAIADFERAHQLDSQLSLAEDAIGMMHSQKHQDASALAIFRQQSEQHPNDALLQYLYAEALSQQDESANEAIKAAKRAVALESGYLPAHDLLCVLYLKTNALQSVITQAQEALKLNPDDEIALYQEMMAYRRLGQKEKVDPLVARLKQVKEQQQKGKQKFLLQETDVSKNQQP
jgi:tetratricopeptide (TPR) repeat protein